MESSAKLSFVRLSPRKTRLVVDMVRGKGIQIALNILRFSPQPSATLIAKLLSSAVANAEQKGVSDVDRLYVKTICRGWRPSVEAFHCRAQWAGQAKSENRPATFLLCWLKRNKQLVGGEVLGQKVNPIGFRLGIIKTWDSKWYAKADFAKLLHEDLKLKAFLKKAAVHSGVSKIEIERAANKAKINIYTARPGLIIGKKGSEVETLKKELAKLTEQRDLPEYSRRSGSLSSMHSWLPRTLLSNWSDGSLSAVP